MMEKVQITREQENMLMAFKEREENSMVLFVQDNTKDHNSAFRWFNEEELALMWMGHYEIKKEPIEVIKTQLRECIEQGECNEYHSGYTDALSYCIRVIESRNIGDKS